MSDPAGFGGSETERGDTAWLPLDARDSLPAPMWQRRFVEAVLRHRGVVLALVAAVSLAAAAGAARLEFRTDLEVWFLDGDPTLVSYREFKERFGADRIAVVGLVAPDVFEPGVLSRVDRLTRALEQAPHVSRVSSLTTARVARAIDGSIEIADLVETLPSDGSEAATLRGVALAHPIVSRTLVSADGRATAIVVELTPGANRPEGQAAFVAAARRILDDAGGDGIRLHFAGSPVLAESMIELSQRDFGRFTPLGLLMLLAIGFAVFRRLSAALIPLPVVILATLWTFGLMGGLGIPLTVISPMLVMLILAVGVADTIHVLADYYRYQMQGEVPREAVVKSVSHLLVPCFCTSATTVGGLLALRVSDLAPLGEFGVLAAAGVSFAFVLSVTLVPVILHLAKPPDARFVERQRSGPLLRLLDRLGHRTARGSRVTLAAGATVVLLAAVAASRVAVVANPLNFFDEDYPMRRDTAAIDEALGGTATIEFLVETAEGGLQDPDTLRRLDDFERWLERRPGVTSALSVVDVYKDLDRVFREREDGAVPASRALAAQYGLLLEGEDDFDRLVQSNYSVGRISARVRLSNADVVIDELPAVEREIGKRFGDGIEVEATGFVRLVTKMDVYLIRSQLRSFLLAVALITLTMMVILRSVALGLFSLIPNLVPILLGVAFMALAGIPLDQGTIMIPSIALGLVVDDSVHFLYRYRAHAISGLAREEALHRTTTETGRPILVTSLILAAGLSTLLAGSFQPAVYFGLIAALVVLVALGATLLLLPAALVLLRPRL